MSREASTGAALTVGCVRRRWDDRDCNEQP